MSLLKDSIFGKSVGFSEVIGEKAGKVHAEIVDSKRDENGSLLYKVCWNLYTWSTVEDLSDYQSLITAYSKKKNASTDFKVVKQEDTNDGGDHQGDNIIDSHEVDERTSRSSEEDSNEDVVVPQAGNHIEVGISESCDDKDENDNIWPSKLIINKRSFQVQQDSEENEHSAGSVDVDDSDADAELSVEKEAKGAVAKSRRKGNPRKVYVQLLEHSNTNETTIVTFDTSSEDHDIPRSPRSSNHDSNVTFTTSNQGHNMSRLSGHSDIPQSSRQGDGSQSSKQRRAASQQAVFASRLRCDFCCIPFESEFYYDLHMSSHDPEEEIFLGKVVDDTEAWDVDEEELALQMDYESDTDDNTKSKDGNSEKGKGRRNVQQSCEVCDKVFIYTKSFRKHKLDCHAGSTCLKCWKTFLSSLELSEHTCESPTKGGKVKVKQEVGKDSNEEHKTAEVVALNSLQCDICDKWFTHLTDLQQHVLSHSDETTFPCTKCDKIFKKKRNLDAHFETCKIRLQCTRCPKTFGTKSYLRMHERIHDGTCPYYCQACDKYFLKKSKLQRHLAADERRKIRMEKAVASKKTEYKCSFCEKVFIDKRNHTMHERIHKGTNPHYCQECDHYFLKRIHLVHHERSIHSKETPYEKCEKRLKVKSMTPEDKEAKVAGKFQCISCGEWFTGLYNLKEHLNTSTTCVSYECEICNQKFLRTKQLRRHMVTHTKEKPFSCAECNRAFAFKWELTKHERIHSKEKQYPCDRCGETFVQKWELNDHVIWHETGKHPKECPTCGRHFSKQSKLDIHIKGVHENRRDHQCTTCGKDFKRKHDLKRHEEFHDTEDGNGANTLTCMVCKQKGFTEETLVTHHLTHMRVEPMEMGDCKPLSLEVLSQFKGADESNENESANTDSTEIAGNKTDNKEDRSNTSMVSTYDTPPTQVEMALKTTISSPRMAHEEDESLQQGATPRGASQDIEEQNSNKNQSTIHYPTTAQGNTAHAMYAKTYQDIAQPPTMCYDDTPHYTTTQDLPSQCTTTQDITPRYMDTNANTMKSDVIQHAARGDGIQELTLQQYSTKQQTPANQNAIETNAPKEGSLNMTPKGGELQVERTDTYDFTQFSATTDDTAMCHNIPHYSTTQYSDTQCTTTSDITPRYITTKLDTHKPATIQHTTRSDNNNNNNNTQENTMQHYLTKQHTTTSDTTQPVTSQQFTMQQYSTKLHSTTSQRASEAMPLKDGSLNVARGEEIQLQRTQPYDFSQFSATGDDTAMCHDTSQYTTTQQSVTQCTVSPDITPRYMTTKLNTLKPDTIQHTAKSNSLDEHTMPHKSKIHTATQGTIESSTSQHVMQDYSTKHHTTTSQRTNDHITSQGGSINTITRGKEIQTQHNQSCDFSQFSVTNADETLRNVPPLEMATFKPLSLQSPKPLQVPGLISAASQSFGDILHAHTAEANLGYSSNATRSDYPTKQLHPPDSFFSQNVNNDPSNKQFSAAADVNEKKLDLMPSYSNLTSNLESFSSLVNNIQPNYLNNVQNSINNNSRISEPNLSSNSQHLNLFSGLLPPSQSAIYLPHNVDKLLMQHKADYSS